MTSHNKGLSYAEDTLGVHKIWVDAQAFEEQLRTLYNTRAGLESGTRQANNQIEERRRSVLMEVTDKLNEGTDKVTQAAVDRNYKLACSIDEELAGLNKILEDTMAHRDAIGAQISSAETNHKGHAARMVELGGYFQYLAAIKTAETVRIQQADLPY